MSVECIDIFAEEEKKKLCKECGVVEIEGHPNKKYCEKCRKERKIVRKYHQKPEVLKKRRINRWKLNGIIPTDGDWEKVWNMIEEQNYNCAICGRNENELKFSLSLDHDHKTGNIRAFICSNCNLVLGNAMDDIEILKKAIDYLKNKKDLKSVCANSII